MIFDSKWQVILVHMPPFVILGLMMATFSVTEARPILTTTDKINERIQVAINAANDQWRRQVDENEKKAKANLEKLTNEKNDAVSELNKARNEFEDMKKNLNISIETLKKEIGTKTKEQETLNKKLTDLEKAQADSKDKAKKELDRTIKQYNSKIEQLNKKIIQKSDQLKTKTTQLKNLNLSFATQSASLYKAEAKTYSDAEILRGTIRTLQSELRALIGQAKLVDIKRMQHIKAIGNQVAVEKQNFAEQIKAIQEAETQNLLRIEKLNNFVQQLIAKNQKLERAGKFLETKLMAKIQALQNSQTQNTQQYQSFTEAYAKPELCNLVAIDQLKQELNNATMKNQSLLKLAHQLNKMKRDEDIADAKMETNLLLKIKDLKKELNIAAQKSEILAKNLATTKKYIDNLKKVEFDDNTKLQNTIRSLMTEINWINYNYNELLQKYNNGKNWKIDYIKRVNNVAPLTVSTPPYPQVAMPNCDSVPARSSVYEASAPEVNVQNTKVYPTKSRDYQLPIMNRSQGRGKWVIEKFNKKFPLLRMRTYAPVPPTHPRNLSQSQYVHQREHVEILPQSNARLEQTAHAPSSPKNINLELQKSQNTTQSATTESEDELVKFALDTTLKTVEKMANYDEGKINASLKLMGAGAEMPKKLSAIVDVIKDKYNPTIYQKVVQEIAKMCKRGTVK